MKTQRIAATMGVGAYALMAGGIILTIGIAESLHAMFPEAPGGMWYLALGGIGIVFGAIACGYGSEKAEQKVEKLEHKFTVEEQVRRNPWAIFAATAGVGFVLGRLLAPSSRSDDSSRSRSRSRDWESRNRRSDHQRSTDEQRRSAEGETNGKRKRMQEHRLSEQTSHEEESIFDSLADTAKTVLTRVALTAASSALGGAAGYFSQTEDDDSKSREQNRGPAY